MSDEWHYAERGTVKRALSLREMRIVLSNIAQPRDLLVWKPGFSDWRRAEDVAELAQLILTPPPVLPPVPPPLPTTPSSITMQPLNKPLVGLGGWLTLLGFSLVVGPLRSVMSLFENYGSPELKFMWQQFPAAVFPEVLLNGALLVMMLWLASLFFQKAKSFPGFYMKVWLAALIIPPVNIISAAIIIAVYSGKSVGELIQAGLDPKDLGQWFAILFWGGLWTAYLKRSRRVANTFVE